MEPVSQRNKNTGNQLIGGATGERAQHLYGIFRSQQYQNLLRTARTHERKTAWEIIQPGLHAADHRKTGRKVFQYLGRGTLLQPLPLLQTPGRYDAGPGNVLFGGRYRAYAHDFTSVHILPYSFQNDLLGIYEESITFLSDKVGIFLPRKHHEHLDFAAMWLENIQVQFSLDP